MKRRFRAMNWIVDKLFPPPRKINCLRCGENLRTPSNVQSLCPRCSLKYGFTGSWEPIILIGDRYSAFSVSDAEDIAKEHGIELPPWPKPPAQ